METVTSTPQKTQGMARGLLLAWRRELEQKLQVNHYLPGCSRGETLKIMTERMPDKRAGDQQWTLYQPDSDSSHMESTQTQYSQVGPSLEATPQKLPETWPK